MFLADPEHPLVGLQAGAVAISGHKAVNGAYGDDNNGQSSAARRCVFDLGCNDCPVDLNGGGAVNTLDFLAYLND
jgi:hypothetical protein